MSRLQVEDDIVTWLWAADERAPVGRGFHRLGAVVDRAGDQSRLAGVTDAGPAGPADGNVTGFGKLQQAAVVLIPRDRQAAARELDRRSGPSPAGRRVRCSCGHRSYARCHAWRGSERFSVD